MDIAANPSAPLATTVLDVTGMTCAGCVRRVERALTTVPGVAAATVNLATQQATVSFDEGRVRPDDLAAAIESAGYGVIDGAPQAAGASSGRTEFERAERRGLVRDLVIAAFATVPLLVLAMSHGALAFAATGAGRVTQFALGTVVLFGPGLRFLRGGVAAVRHRSPDMNTLVSLGALSAWGWSTVVTFAHGVERAPHVYFEAAAAIVAFVLLGKFLESRARWRLGDAVRALHALVPAQAHRLADATATEERDVAVAALRKGDLVRVRPGERVPSDGIVVDGGSAIDESLLTGESVPVDKAGGDRVVAGGLNTTGTLVVRVDRIGADTALARIAAAVEQAQGSRAQIARFADRVSAVFVPVVLALAVVTFATWSAIDPSTDGVARAIERMVAVLVIACPCALGLATPAAVAVGAGRGAELGVLFRTGTALEQASRIDTVFLDKTGTLTEGRPAVVAVEGLAGVGSDTVLQLAASAEAASEHPFARAMVAAARAKGIALLPSRRFVATPAMGVEARIDGATVHVGKAAWFAAAGFDVGAAAVITEVMTMAGRSPLSVARDGRVIGVVGIADELRPEAAAVVAALRQLGVRTGVLSGDRRGVVAAVCAPLGVDEQVAELLPAQKAQHVAAARAAGRRVAMIGDGVNDAQALAAADLGIAIGGGTDVAAAAADVALLRGGLTGLVVALRLGRATMRTIRRNLVWASVYNLLGVPVAAGVFAGAGVELSPVWASAAMSLSSVSVLTSSLALRRFGRAAR